MDQTSQFGVLGGSGGGVTPGGDPIAGFGKQVTPPDTAVPSGGYRFVLVNGVNETPITLDVLEGVLIVTASLSVQATTYTGWEAQLTIDGIAVDIAYYHKSFPGSNGYTSIYTYVWAVTIAADATIDINVRIGNADVVGGAYVLDASKVTALNIPQ